MEHGHNWTGSVHGWVVNDIAKQGWRASRNHSSRDLEQEAYIVFDRCARRYPGVEPRHFMALFMTAWRNKMHDLAAAASHYHGTQHESPGDAPENVGSTDNDGVLAVMVRQAPRDIRLVLSLFLNAPEELLQTALSSWQGAKPDNGGAGGSETVNRLLGLPLKQDTLGMVRRYFGG